MRGRHAVAGAAALTLALGCASAAAQTPEETTSTSVEETTTSTSVEETATSSVEETTTTSVDETTTTSIDEATTTTVEEESTTTSESTTSTATTTTTTVPDELSITPAPAADLGQATAQVLVAQLGEVIVTNEGSEVPRRWTALVAATGFANETGQVLPSSDIAYASGGALPGTTALDAVPGQLTVDQAVPLDVPVVAFSGSTEAVPTQVVWNPTIIITLPPDPGDGQYRGTITHSVF